MSDARVNLLPDEQKRRDAQGRRTAGLAAGFGVLVLAIGGVYYWQVTRVNDAQAVVDEEQAELQALQAEQAELQNFAELRTLREEGDATIVAALGAEVSVAGILQDTASVMPPDAQLDALTVTVSGLTEPGLGDERAAWGTMTMSGQTRLGHAPGLERFLLEFDKIAAFSDLYFSNSTVDERGVSTFSATLELGPEVLTNRYVNGLPEELR